MGTDAEPFWFTLRRPELRQVFHRFKMFPGALLAVEEQKALGAKAAEVDAIWVKESNEELYQLVLACLCDCCVEPKIAPTQAEADADESGDTLCITDILRDEVMDKLAEPVFELLGLTLAEARMLAPFRKSAHDNPAGAELGHEAGSTSGQPIVNGL